MLRAQLEPAYVLNRRPYREDSALIDLLTQQHGLVRLVGRGMRRKKQPLGAILQPFAPLLISWQSKTELGQLQQAETASPPLLLSGDQTLAGFYLNELVYRLLTPLESAPSVFAHYGSAIAQLAASDSKLEPVLRQFEHALLDHLGYGLSDTQHLDGESFYQWQPQQGLVLCDHQSHIQGWHLQCIEASNYDDESVLRAAKILTRQRLEPLLAGRPLQSRQVWLQMKRGKV
ncbi:DNA repair protein RecO [Neiella sp. HB171785]|uniref:DNA repair protein RecO n=1 Tax=Neiella litorisoli TaxID=2771431 RepID=A0A8J6UJ69_9GAMM|nr:DNA repair protein RecO [Neiella litorisoli]MBD1390003.1 DNA repair protein RecO [Neiella litorisoli]